MKILFSTTVITTAVLLCGSPATTAGPNSTPIRNGELDQWAEGGPLGWKVGQGVASDRDTNMRISGIAAARLYPKRRQTDIYPSSSISQEIELEPETAYLLTFWAAKDGTGDVRAYVIPKSGGGPVLEYLSGWANFFPWTEIRTTFRTGPAKEYTLRLIQYGKTGSQVWFDRIALKRLAQHGEVTKRKVDPAKRDIDFFSQSYMIPLGSDNLDATSQLTDAFSVQLARNEYEPFLVGIRSRRALKAVDLRLTGDLRSAEGNVLARDRITVRAYEDGVLPLTRPRDVEAAHNLGWWLTVKSDADLAVGQYKGKLQIMAVGKVIAEAELVVEVLDLTLPKPDIAFFVYHAECYFREEHGTPALKRAYYKDMVEHGMTTVTVYGSPDIDGENIDFAHNYGHLKDKRPADFDWGFDKVMPAVVESGLCRDGLPVILLLTRMAQGGRPACDFGCQPEVVTRRMLEEWSQRGWPEPLLYVHDEPSYKERIDAVRPALERIKSWKLPLRTVTSGLDIHALGHLYDVWIQSESEISREMVESAQKQESELWTYNCNVPYVNAPFDRALYGFWAYRAGVRGVGQWAYHDSAKAHVDDKGKIHGMAGPRLSRIFSSSKGPVPTVSWEATREGVDDYRLLILYQATLKQADTSLEGLRARYKKLLSEDDMRELKLAEERKGTKFKAGEKPLSWEPRTRQQRQGKLLFETARALELAIEKARLAWKKVVESVPADAMAVRAAIPFGAKYETLYPPLGLGDQRIVAEIKRRTLVGYIERLRVAIAQGAMADRPEGKME